MLQGIGRGGEYIEEDRSPPNYLIVTPRNYGFQSYPTNKYVVEVTKYS